MTSASHRLRAIGLTTALVALSACTGGQTGMLNDLDWDFRGGGNTLDTTAAAQQATAARPSPDANGVISYPGYQVAVARRGDTVGSVAARVGLNPAELAGYNAIQPNAPLREGEVLALPRRVAAAGSGGGAGGVIGGGTVAAAPIATGGAVSVTSIATTALDRVQSSPTAAAAPAATAPNDSALGAMAPTRHQVKRGETAFSIARSYNVSARALADWNGLGPDLAVREGQYLMIPTPSGAPPERPVEVVTAPGQGSPTPPPPSAAKPLPEEETKPAAQAAQDRPASPDLGQQRTAASAAQFAMPVAGNIIRGYQPPRNEGIDIAAPAGTPVKAAAAGTVAAITQDTAQTPIIVIRHEGGLLTVYAGVAGTTVKKGDRVTKGQTIANVRSGNPSFLHFEVRRGAASTDPMPFLK
ncbi:peptidase M23 [Tabrizicola sp. TH137]|uniref:peptidoglycan DD-metalloendopeptidase family protein n=1 Tax=Tabrizicola sp. TH137 TaxID=2067452 RepID=UPI000C7C2171|nr:M23 family metallopeptidase [Tabrizicola sp. TH137]PLL13634.1 peptidase M23 [Tabrizicola sp. TH137]